MSGRHRRPPEPCPTWCAVAPHRDYGDMRVHATVPVWVTSVAVSITQIWDPELGWAAPRVCVSRIGSARTVQLTLPEEVIAFAEVLDTTNGALQLRRAVYEIARQFERIAATYTAATQQARGAQT